MEEGKENIDQIIERLTPKELRFCQLYAQCLNGAKSAREAGYSEDYAREIASQNLTKLHIKRVIAYYLQDSIMSIEEATKRLSDVASTRLNDYLKVRKVLQTPTVRKPLRQIINEIKVEIDLEEEYFQLAESDEGDDKKHAHQQKKRRNEILRYELELKRNPNAFRDVFGEPEWVERVDVDLVALAQEYSKGNIKTLSFTEYGPKVEMYAADSAIKTLLEVQGKFGGLKEDIVVNISF